MIRIYNVYHKSSNIVKNKYIIPIQVGNGEPIKGVSLRDNVEINIANKNPTFCELTAQ